MHPDRPAMQKVADAAAHRFDQQPGALERVAREVDHDFGPQIHDLLSERPRRFFDRAVEFRKYDLPPRTVGNVWLPLRAAHADDCIAGLNQARRQVRSDVAGSADNDNAPPRKPRSATWRGRIAALRWLLKRLTPSTRRGVRYDPMWP